MIYFVVHGVYEGRFITLIREDIIYSKSTVYISIHDICSFILQFPKPIVSDLNICHIMKHKKHIINDMSKEENNKHAAQLADPVELRFGLTKIKINSRKCEIPKIKGLSSGANWKFMDKRC